MTGEHVSQLMIYLHLLDLPRGKLINFRSTKVDSRFVNAPLSPSTRRAFFVDRRKIHGADHLVDVFIDIHQDLGTGLSLSLYQEVAVHLLSGEESVVAMIPLTEGDTI
ncbi:hypothetical protein VN12_14745 [Pirellula sp. SH-Sr6A]|nr:hypothetical protein VN12_14745 [Pirellula sp. SH-Sr6A]